MVLYIQALLYVFVRRRIWCECLVQVVEFSSVTDTWQLVTLAVNVCYSHFHDTQALKEFIGQAFSSN